MIYITDYIIIILYITLVVIKCKINAECIKIKLKIAEYFIDIQDVLFEYPIHAIFS